jgi:hypothetical protein
VQKPAHGEVCAGCILTISSHAILDRVRKILILRVHFRRADDVGGRTSIAPGYP